MQLPQLNVYGDSALVIKQLTREFEVKKLKLKPFWRHAGELLAQIPEASVHYVPRSENGPADALAGIAVSLAQFDQRPCQVPICERWVIPPPAEEETEEKQTKEIEESLPISASQISNRRLERDYHKLPLTRHTSRRPVRASPNSPGSSKTHSGICGAHQAGPKLHLQVKRLGYYWPSMLRDAIEMARTCKQCQLHADYIHRASEPLHPTVASWLFEAWGMDIICPISPKSDSDRQYILAATDYSKWAEAAAYREVKAVTVRTQIIYRYRVPRYIMTTTRTSSAYNPTANGLAEAFNKTLCKILKKTIGANKKSWDEKLDEALGAYRTSFRTPTQSTPYSLVYGTEAVLPLEVQLPSLRIAMREGLTMEECAQLGLAELESLDEQRLEAQQRLECYQSRMT
ncbi:hypothetical protein H6P81_018391 [Aristolochia fimbriata]|uniref:Uncharacterized protein n=1 Tax=Aristolochia fimbriata TaxID=158543 RepID=A0AAV7E190_ARIFI|nr:hypothetical protein H6P81_018391 [Aristolochia fimbriata]